MNDCKFLGRLGSDVELKHTPSGATVGNFSVAVSEKDKNGDEKTEWIRCEVWGKNAGYASQVLQKGSEVAILSSKVTTRSWEKDGKKNYATSFVVFRFRPIAASQPRTQETQTETVQQTNPNFFDQTQKPQGGFQADDIPF